VGLRQLAYHWRTRGYVVVPREARVFYERFAHTYRRAWASA
jgi:GR25 family glycosyltransferase involved in LPS biosynthesis